MGGSTSTRANLVFFDLGTTERDEILQIAAKCGDKTFNEYIRPFGQIPYSTTEIYGFYMRRGVMYNRYDEPMRAVTQREAVQNFLNFLKSFNNKVILVAHDCHRVDGPTLLRIVGDNCEFKDLVAGFSDTLPILQKKLPFRRWWGSDYGLPRLADDFLDYNDIFRGAMTDASLLESLAKHPDINISYSEFVAKMKTTETMLKTISSELLSVC